MVALEIEKKKNLALEISRNDHLKKDQKPLWRNRYEVLKNQNLRTRDMVEKIRLVLMIGIQTIFHKTENQTNLQKTEDQINFLEMVTINFNLDPKKVLKLNLKAVIMVKKVALI